MKPWVSVILAVYNGEKYLSEAIDTVLAQTYPQIELLVIDDGSQDRTAEIAKNYGAQLRYFFQPNRGQPSAQNYGLSMAKSSYITFLDADDLYLPDKIALLIEVLETFPSVDFAFGSVEQFFSFDASLEIREKKVCPQGTSPGYLSAAGLFRKECFEKVGLFNENQPIGAFIEWSMRADENGLKSTWIDRKVLRRRIHENNTGISVPEARSKYLEIIKAALKRRLLI